MNDEDAHIEVVQQPAVLLSGIAAHQVLPHQRAASEHVRRTATILASLRHAARNATPMPNTTSHDLNHLQRPTGGIGGHDAAAAAQRSTTVGVPRKRTMRRFRMIYERYEETFTLGLSLLTGVDGEPTLGSLVP